jgi:branched-chain amino acid transport system substrate-binding protein
MRRTIALVVVLLALAPAGAAAADLTVYSSLPLTGATRSVAEDIVAGERLALEQAGGMAGVHTVRLVSLNDAERRAGTWTPQAVAANARRAALDRSTIAYLGEFNSGATAISLPILNERRIPQVSPSNTYVGLTRREGAEPGEPDKYYPRGVRTFVRLAGADHLQAAAIVRLLAQDGVRRVFLVDDREVYGRGMRRMVARRLRGSGIRLAGRASLGRPAAAARRVARSRADAMVFTGITANGAPRLWREVHRRAPRMRLVGSDGIGESRFTRRIGRAARRTSITLGVLASEAYPPAAQPVLAALDQRLGRPVSGYALYGYEAMNLVLEAIRAADPARPLRPQVTAALFAIRDRDSVLGRYSIDRFGDTTLGTYGIYRIDTAGRLQFERAI